MAIMAENLMSELEKNGADVKSTLDRFMGKQELYEKFLKKFAHSTDCTCLIENLKMEDYGEAFRSAHTLKGVAGNLGLVPIQTLASEITELLRGKEEPDIDKAAVQEKRLELEGSYDTFMKIIKENLE